MSITDAIKDMKKHMGIDNFEDYMNAPLPHNNQGYVQRKPEYINCRGSARRVIAEKILRSIYEFR